MKTYTAAELAEILEKHGRWLRGDDGGELANLRGVDLRLADLRLADLRLADLRGANLRGANLREASGNHEEVRATQCDLWSVTYTATHMAIGCQQHEIAEWWAFDDAAISRMDERALRWWRVWKPILQQIIATAPARPYAEKEKNK